MLLLNNKTVITSKEDNISVTPTTWAFDFINKVEIRSSWDTFTDTATLMMPKKIHYFNSLSLETSRLTGEANPLDPSTYPVFVQGDKVELSGGYGDDVPLMFSGYIRAIAPNYPIKFDFEDGMYWLKNLEVEKKTWPEKGKTIVTLKEIVEYVTKDRPEHIKLNIADVEMVGDFQIDPSMAIDTLNYLKKQFNLVSWMRDGVLNSGVAYLTNNVDEVLIHRFWSSGPKVNIISTDQLVYKTEDQVKVKVKFISIYPDNSREEVVVGALDGALRTIYDWNIPKSGMEKMANQWLDKLVYEGYTGYFTTFLLPLVKHGDAVKLSDVDFPEREGTYLVKEVITNYGVDGGRQKITLDMKIA
jgi:hypothetical protein